MKLNIMLAVAAIAILQSLSVAAGASSVRGVPGPGLDLFEEQVALGGHKKKSCRSE